LKRKHVTYVGYASAFTLYRAVGASIGVVAVERKCCGGIYEEKQRWWRGGAMAGLSLLLQALCEADRYREGRDGREAT